jgi:hypothetical protein
VVTTAEDTVYVPLRVSAVPIGITLPPQFIENFVEEDMLALGFFITDDADARSHDGFSYEDGTSLPLMY